MVEAVKPTSNMETATFFALPGLQYT